MNKFISLLTLVVGGAVAASSEAAVMYTGTPYTQNFDSLASTGTNIAFTDDSTIPGWTAYNGETGYSGSGVFTFGLGAPQTQANDYNPSDGSSNAGDLFSFGTSSGDRALGSVASSGTDEFFFALHVINDTGADVSGFQLSYDGEQWRRGNNATQRAEYLLFFYRVGGAVFDNSGTWTSVGALDFTSPNSTDASALALDGNAPSNRATLSGNVSITLAAGADLWLVWVDPDNGGTDHGLGIDNVSLSLTAAVPEPSSALWALFACATGIIRRRR